MPGVRCPDCGALVEVPPGTRSGALLECSNCAGQALRLHAEAGRWSASLAHRVSCPTCDEVVTLPEDVKPGDRIQCCGQTYRLTFEYGAFAAERMSDVGGTRHESLGHHDWRGGVGGSRPGLPLLPAPADRDPARARQRGVHGDDHALSLAAAPHWTHRYRDRLRLVPTGETSL